MYAKIFCNLGSRKYVVGYQFFISTLYLCLQSSITQSLRLHNNIKETVTECCHTNIFLINFNAHVLKWMNSLIIFIKLIKLICQYNVVSMQL